MIRINFCNLLVLSLVISCVLATEDKEKVDEKDKKDEKSVSKRGVFHYSTHGHVHPGVVSATHYHLPPAVPHFHKYHVKPHLHLPVAPVPVAPVIPPHYHIVPGGASVTSYSVNYPRYPLLPRPVVPYYPKHIVPAFAPPVVASAPAAFIPDHTPSFHHHHQPHYVPHYHSAPIVPSYVLPKPVIPVAVAYPHHHHHHAKYPIYTDHHHHHAKYPVYIGQHKPSFTGVHPQLIPVAPTPTFIPVAVPANPPQPVAPPTAVHPGTAQDTNFVSATQDFPQIPMPTQPTFVHQPTKPTITSHGWRPVVMMTQNHHNSQTTQPTFTNNHAPYNYHAPAVAFNHDPSTNDIISGHGQVSSQLAHQLALYQHQQHLHQQQQYVQQQQQHESRLKHVIEHDHDWLGLNNVLFPFS